MATLIFIVLKIIQKEIYWRGKSHFSIEFSQEKKYHQILGLGSLSCSNEDCLKAGLG